MNIPQDEIDEFVAASGRGDLKVMRVFLSDNLKEGVPDLLDSTGYTALATAAHHGWKLSVSMLLSWGADINARSTGGRTALMEAIAAGSTDAAKMLLEKGADASLRDDDGWTAHSIASFFNRDDILPLLTPVETVPDTDVVEEMPVVDEEIVLGKLRQAAPRRNPFGGGPRQ